MKSWVPNPNESGTPREFDLSASWPKQTEPKTRTRIMFVAGPEGFITFLVPNPPYTSRGRTHHLDSISGVTVSFGDISRVVHISPELSKNLQIMTLSYLSNGKLAGSPKKRRERLVDERND